MPLDGVKAPQLLLIEPFGLAFLVVDFNGPAVAANARDAGVCHTKRLEIKNTGLSYRSNSIHVSAAKTTLKYGA